MRINHFDAFLMTSMLFLLAGSGVADAATDPVQELKNCARTADKAERVACYEALGKRVLGKDSMVVTTADQEPPATQIDISESATEKPTGDDASIVETAVSEVGSVESTVAAASAVAAPTVLPESNRIPEDLGQDDKKDRKEEESAEKKSYRGHVRSCGQMSDNRWYFVFGNGQVWKQSNKGSYRFKKCDFDVTITSDFFGYKMRIDGGKSLRVRREQ